MQPDPQLQRVPNGGWDERILVFQSERLVTSFAVCTTRYVVLIDTLFNLPAAWALAAECQDELAAGRRLLVINTHADWDHAWGNGVFAGASAEHPAPIIGHALCRVRLQSTEAAAELAAKQAAEPERFTSVRLEPPSITFEDGLVVDGGDLQLQLIPTPGHTPDHVSVWLPQLRTLFVGDAAERPLPFVDTAATLPQLRASLERLAALDATTAFYCHAPGVTQPTVIADNLAYFATLEQRCRAALAAGRVPGALAEDADLAALVGFALAEVPGGAELPDQERHFYADAHRQAIAAMLDFVRTTG